MVEPRSSNDEQFLSCEECQAFFIVQEKLDKHNEMCHKGHQEEELPEGQSETSSGKAEGKKSPVEQDNNETVSVSMVSNEGLPVSLEKIKEILGADNNNVMTGFKVTLESVLNRDRVATRRQDGLVNEITGTSGSFVPQAVLPTHFENGNKEGATSSSRTHLPQGTVKNKSILEGVLPGTSANATDLVEKIDYFKCKLCDQPAYPHSEDLAGHLVSRHSVDKMRASAAVKKLQKSEANNDEDGSRAATHNGGEDSGQGVGAVDDVNSVLDDAAGARITIIGQKPNPGVSHELYQLPRAEGIDQSTTVQIDSTPSKETKSPNVEVHNNHGRSSAERISNRMQPPADGIVKCKWCTKSFPLNCHLTGHIRRHHPDEKIVKCTQCKWKTAESLMGEHISNRHGNTQYQRTVASTSKAFLISQPPAVLSRRGGISLSHRTEKNHPCDKCRLTFRRPSYLEDHKATAHDGERPYTCRFCHYQDTCRYKFNGHMKNVHGINGAVPTREA